MIQRVFVEEELKNHPRTLKILQQLEARKELKSVETIDCYQNYFAAVKKPYLQKRDSLNLFIAKKTYPFVKETPVAYGLSNHPHYYFIYQYNCLYECEYCYLQGYFHSPDLVLFINYEDIIQGMQEVLDKTPRNIRPYFHAGEFSDSLALTHLSDEWPTFFSFFEKNPRAELELRTKSSNVNALLKLPPLPNVCVSYSLSPQEQAISYDFKTPNIKHRLLALQKLQNAGYKIGLHFDPIIYSSQMETHWENFLEDLKQHIELQQVAYISLGVVRFTKKVFDQFALNYPNSLVHKQELIKTENDFIKYPRPLRLKMLRTVRQKLLQYGVREELIYDCME